MPFRDLSYARVDTHRELRQGASEAILGQGKTPEQVAGIALALADAGASSVLVTRADDEIRRAVTEVLPDAVEHELARAVWVERTPLESTILPMANSLAEQARRRVARPAETIMFR